MPPLHHISLSPFSSSYLVLHTPLPPITLFLLFAQPFQLSSGLDWSLSIHLSSPVHRYFLRSSSVCLNTTTPSSHLLINPSQDHPLPHPPPTSASTRPPNVQSSLYAELIASFSDCSFTLHGGRVPEPQTSVLWHRRDICAGLLEEIHERYR